MVEWFFNYSTRRQCIVFLSSLAVHFEGNLLEWGQLFSGETLWCGDNFPEGNFPWGQLSSGAIVRGPIFLEGNCPRTRFFIEHLRMIAFRRAQDFTKNGPNSNSNEISKAYYQKGFVICFLRSAYSRFMDFLIETYKQRFFLLLNFSYSLPNSQFSFSSSKLTFFNIVEKTSVCQPEIEGNPENKTDDIAAVQSTMRKYQTHPSILNVKSKNTVRTHWNSSSNFRANKQNYKGIKCRENNRDW